MAWEAGRLPGLREGDTARMGIGDLGDSGNLGIGVGRELIKAAAHFPPFLSSPSSP